MENNLSRTFLSGKEGRNITLLQNFNYTESQIQNNYVEILIMNYPLKSFYENFSKYPFMSIAL